MDALVATRHLTIGDFSCLSLESASTLIDSRSLEPFPSSFLSSRVMQKKNKNYKNKKNKKNKKA